MKTFLAMLALAMLGSGMSAAEAALAHDCSYTYADDFSTNAVATDSYSHSMIEDHFCWECLVGWLMFSTDSTGNRGLGFYPGAAYGSMNASVTYGFPQDGAAGGMVGTLEFDALPAVSLAGTGGGFGWAYVIVGHDDVYDATAHISQPGHYTFDLAPPPTASKVRFSVTGQIFRLDNLAVCMDTPTPTRATNWGRLKSIYR